MEFLSCAGSRWESLLANPVVVAASALAGDVVDVMVQAAAAVVAAEAMALRRDISGGFGSPTLVR